MNLTTLIKQSLIAWGALSLLGGIALAEDLSGQLTNPDMRLRFAKMEALVTQATQELAEACQMVADGKILKESVHGRCLANVKNDLDFRAIVYWSSTGGIKTFEKRVYSDAGYKNQIPELGYFVEFDSKGQLLRAMRGTLRVEYYPNGQPKMYGDSIYVDGKYSGKFYKATWDTAGKLVSAGWGGNPLTAQKEIPEEVRAKVPGPPPGFSPDDRESRGVGR